LSDGEPAQFDAKEETFWKKISQKVIL